MARFGLNCLEVAEYRKGLHQRSLFRRLFLCVFSESEVYHLDLLGESLKILLIGTMLARNFGVLANGNLVVGQGILGLLRTISLDRGKHEWAVEFEVENGFAHDGPAHRRFGIHVHLLVECLPDDFDLPRQALLPEREERHLLSVVAHPIRVAIHQIGIQNVVDGRVVAVHDLGDAADRLAVDFILVDDINPLLVGEKQLVLLVGGLASPTF